MEILQQLSMRMAFFNDMEPHFYFAIMFQPSATKILDSTNKTAMKKFFMFTNCVKAFLTSSNSQSIQHYFVALKSETSYLPILSLVMKLKI